MQYEVLTPLKRNGKLYRPGELVELTREEAETMPGTVKAVRTSAPEVSVNAARTRRSK